MRFLALTLLLPTLALAQPAPEAPPVATPGEATWSLGAGGGLSTVYLGYPAFYGLSGGSVPSARVFVPSASVEWRLASRTWLVFGLTGLVSSQSNDPPPTGMYGVLDGDTKWLAASVGVRQVVWGRSLFEVSVLGLGELGVSSAHSRYQQGSGAIVAWDSDAWLVGVSLGLAVDRELTPGLSIRLATPLLGARWQEVTTTQAGSQAVNGHDLQVSAELAPRLELRLAF
jgi:hypothetical protein